MCSLEISLCPFLSAGELQCAWKQVFQPLSIFLTTLGIFKSTCHIDVRWFPFDVQRCELKFGSWTYGGWSLDLKMMDADITNYIANGEWDLVGKRGCWWNHWKDFVLNFLSNPSDHSRLCFVLGQRFQEKGVSAPTAAVRSRTPMSPSPWWCADGRSTTASIFSSPVSWSPLWPCLSSSCLPTPGRRSHWVRENWSTCFAPCRVLQYKDKY